MNNPTYKAMVTVEIPVELTAEQAAQSQRIAELEAANAELRAVNDELRKQNRILDLSVQLEEDLQNRAYDLLARMHLPQGWSVVEVAQLIIDMQKRIAADWVKIGHLMNKAYPPF